MMEAKAPVVEIVETNPVAEGPIIPDDIRINGESILVSADDPVTVEQIDLQHRDVVRVTLTLLARRVSIGPDDVVA